MGGVGLEISIASQFGIQLLGVVSIIVYCGIVSYILFKILDMTLGLRVSESEEIEGLDFTSHGERGYIL